MSRLNPQPYALSLLLEANLALSEVQAALAAAETQAAVGDAELTALLGELATLEAKIIAARGEATQASRQIADGNERAAPLLRQRGILQKRAAELREAQSRAAEPAAQAQIRRSRALLNVQIEDLDANISELEKVGQQARERLALNNRSLLDDGDKARALNERRSLLQAHLPDPRLYARRAAALLGRAHAAYMDTQNVAHWRQEIGQACDQVVALHKLLRSGRYHLSDEDELLGARSPIVAEALCGALALGEVARAQAIFDAVEGDDAAFHGIFHVFRFYVVGGLLTKRDAELRAWCAPYVYSQGARGGYALAATGMMEHDQDTLRRGLKMLAIGNASMWSRHATPTLGLIDLPVLALLRLAKRRALTWTLPDTPTLPQKLVTALNF